MSVTLFPIIQPQIEATVPTLYREVKWDFKNNIPVFEKGSPIIVTGKEAVLTWAWKALNTPRFRYEIYTWNYGNEINSLIGRPFSHELKRSEAARYIKECLLINPYITGVSIINVGISDDKLTISCNITTVYGEESINV